MDNLDVHSHEVVDPVEKELDFDLVLNVMSCMCMTSILLNGLFIWKRSTCVKDCRRMLSEKSCYERADYIRVQKNLK